MQSLSPVTFPVFTLLLLSLGCGDKEDDTSTEEADTDADTDADIVGVEGTLVLSGCGEIDLVDGRAFADEGEGGALKILLTSFSVSCAMVEDGMGWNTPSGGAFVRFYPDLDDDAEVLESDGTLTQATAYYSVSADVSENGGEAVGTVTLDSGDGGTASFRVENCGPMDPFGS